MRALADMLRAHQIGELPVVIQPDPVWSDSASDEEAGEVAWREFADVGLADRSGRLGGDVLDTLHVLARPRLEYQAMLLGRDSVDGVVLAAHGEEAVIAERVGDTVTLSSVRHVSLPETFLRQIPDARPAPIEAVNVRVDDLAGRDGDSFGDTSAMARDARTLAYLKRQRLIRQGELYVATRDAYGRRRVSPAIRFQDYRTGRVAVVIGDGYLSVVPATKVLLRDRLRTAHSTLAG